MTRAEVHTSRWHRIKFWMRWCFTSEGARAQAIFRVYEESGQPITRGVAMTLSRARRR